MSNQARNAGTQPHVAPSEKSEVRVPNPIATSGKSATRPAAKPAGRGKDTKADSRAALVAASKSFRNKKDDAGKGAKKSGKAVKAAPAKAGPAKAATAKIAPAKSVVKAVPNKATKAVKAAPAAKNKKSSPQKATPAKPAAKAAVKSSTKTGSTKMSKPTNKPEAKNVKKPAASAKGKVPAAKAPAKSTAKAGPAGKGSAAKASPPNNAPTAKKGFDLKAAAAKVAQKSKDAKASSAKAAPAPSKKGSAKVVAPPPPPPPPVKKGPTDFQPTGLYNGIMVNNAPKPFPLKTPYSKEELTKLKEALQEERVRLLAELASLKGMSNEALEIAKEHPGYSLHMAEHATDLQTAETQLGVRTIEEERLELVDQALERIQKSYNQYGLCLACGAKIGIQRLIARPHAHLCMPCRTKYEEIKSKRGY